MTTAPHVYQAISAVTAVMAKEGIGKTKNNAAQGYKFRGIDEVYNALSSHLAANHLCMLPRVIARDSSERTTAKGAVMIYTTLTVEFDFVSSLDGSKHTICTVGEAMDSGDKSSNKAMSAAMKYACLVAFQIPTEGDNDADAHSPEPAVRRAAPAAAPVAGAKPEAGTEAYVQAIDLAPDTTALMRIYTVLQADAALAESAKAYVVALCSAKRRQIETKGKAA